MKIIKTKNKMYLTRVFVLLLFGLNLLSVAEASDCAKYLNVNDMSIEYFEYSGSPNKKIYPGSSLSVRFAIKNNNSLCRGIIPPLQAGIFDSQNKLISISEIMQTDIELDVQWSPKATSGFIHLGHMTLNGDVGTYKIVIKTPNLLNNSQDFNNWITLKSVEFPVCYTHINIANYFIKDFKIHAHITIANSPFGIQFNLQKNSPCETTISQLVVQIHHARYQRYSFVPIDSVISTIYAKNQPVVGLTYPVSTITAVKAPPIKGNYEIIIGLEEVARYGLKELTRIPFAVNQTSNDADYNNTIQYIDKCVNKYQKYFGSKEKEKFACSLGYKWNLICQNTSGGERLDIRLNNKHLYVSNVTKMALDPDKKKWYFLYDDFRDGKKKWSPDELNLILPYCD
jgi:hypothetical protein